MTPYGEGTGQLERFLDPPSRAYNETSFTLHQSSTLATAAVLIT